MIEGSGSVPPTNGSGSGSKRPENIRIRRIRIRIRNTGFNVRTYVEVDATNPDDVHLIGGVVEGAVQRPIVPDGRHHHDVISGQLPHLHREGEILSNPDYKRTFVKTHQIFFY